MLMSLMYGTRRSLGRPMKRACTYLQFRLLCLHWVSIGLLRNTNAGFVGFLLFATCLADSLLEILDWGVSGDLGNTRDPSLRWAFFQMSLINLSGWRCWLEAFRSRYILRYWFDGKVVKFKCV
jgi:hypothetical protein